MQTCAIIRNYLGGAVRVKKQGYIKGALIISVGGLISKLLGAVYRIPLVAYLGGEGMGLYQLVYPLYCILLTLSASGIPTGIARLVAADGGGKNTVGGAFYLYGVIGVVGTVVMFLAAKPLAFAQGEEAVAFCCRLLAPSVFFVAIIAVVRGYFQGKSNMYPTAFTEVAEQLIKVVVGVSLARRYRGDVFRATSSAIFAVTASEAIACLFAAVFYLTEKGGVKPLFKIPSPSVGRLLKFTLPLTVSAIALPVSQLAESIVVVNVLRSGGQNATALYGIFSGCAVTLINLPVSVTYGLAAASVPQISPLAASGNFKEAAKKIKKSLSYTALISLPCAVGLYLFSPLATNLIFSSLKLAEKELLIRLVRIMCINALTSSLVQTSSACITSLGKPVWNMFTQWGCAVLRIVLSFVLTAFTPLSIIGVAVSANVCYFVAVIFNLCYITVVIKISGGNKNDNNVNRLGHASGRFNPFGKIGA